ncbi:hypothetical protein [Streptomyces sp. 3N207]|uniref:hypothetical protein n=1 Tax=Streptomyces sp. 3N207 TaxID=3457417 RepID=UPI003FD0B87B
MHDAHVQAPWRSCGNWLQSAMREELTALGFGRVSRVTVQRMRLTYRKQGMWGLDHRTTRGPSSAGRQDERAGSKE